MSKVLKFNRARFEAGEMPTRTRSGLRVLHVHDCGLNLRYPIGAWIEGGGCVFRYTRDGRFCVEGEHVFDLVHEPRTVRETVGVIRRPYRPGHYATVVKSLIERARREGRLIAEHTFEIEES